MPSDPSRYLVVVRRGQLVRFQALVERLEETGLVEVIWDRRMADRRGTVASVALDRRRRERRARPPATWVVLDFVLIARGDRGR